MGVGLCFYFPEKKIVLLSNVKISYQQGEFSFLLTEFATPIRGSAKLSDFLDGFQTKNVSLLLKTLRSY